jgi:uncharacterized cofD-like protein
MRRCSAIYSKYRFPAGCGLRRHTFGNLFLTALTKVTGDFTEAVRLRGQVLAIRGRIFPSTLENVTLEAVMEDGRVLAGETQISCSGKGIRRVRLVPRRVRPLPEVIEAIRQADLITVGPGSLYTSLIPNLLVSGVVEAMRRSHARRVYIANLMTQPGETLGYSVADHIRAIDEHTRGKLFDWVVINHAPVSTRLLRHYRAEGAEPVTANIKELQRMGLHCILDDLLEENGLVRHNPVRLTRLLLEEFLASRPG